MLFSLIHSCFTLIFSSFILHFSPALREYNTPILCRIDGCRNHCIIYNFQRRHLSPRADPCFIWSAPESLPRAHVSTGVFVYTPALCVMCDIIVWGCVCMSICWCLCMCVWVFSCFQLLLSVHSSCCCLCRLVGPLRTHQAAGAAVRGMAGIKYTLWPHSKEKKKSSGQEGGRVWWPTI